MKIVIAIFAILMSFIAHAGAPGYNWNGNHFPDELSTDGLPEVFPCKTLMNGVYKVGYGCVWLTIPRELTFWDDRRKQEVTTRNQSGGECKRGTCTAFMNGGVPVGNIPEDVDRLVISIWYYVWTSTDGQVVAYLKGHGPKYNGTEYSHAEASAILKDFYIRSNMAPDEIEYEFKDRGSSIPVVSKDSVAAVPAPGTKVTEAWCNSMADDDCTINGVSVPMATLPDYLPVVDPDLVSAASGYCEPVICFDKNDKPVGLNKYSF